MIIMKDTLLAAALFLLGASPAISENSKDDVWAECRATDNCTIQFDRLSDQDADPFLLQGIDVEREMPSATAIKRAIQKFPSTQSCLNMVQISDGETLGQFSWERPNSSEELSVCLFRVAASMQDFDAFSKWLEIKGFRRKGPSQTNDEAVLKFTGLTADDVSYLFSMGLKAGTSHVAKDLRHGAAGWLAYGISISVFVGSTGELKGVWVGFSRL